MLTQLKQKVTKARKRG